MYFDKKKKAGRDKCKSYIILEHLLSPFGLDTTTKTEHCYKAA